MPSSIHAPTDVKEFEARTARIVVDGESEVEDLESFGYEQSKGHELQYTIDQNAVWVKSTPEITGSFVLKATSPSIPTVESLWLDDVVFNIDLQLSEDAFGGDDQETLTFIGCMITDFSHSDYQIDDMPTVTADWQGVNQGQ